jgi:hypothetical protein
MTRITWDFAQAAGISAFCFGAYWQLRRSGVSLKHAAPALIGVLIWPAAALMGFYLLRPTWEEHALGAAIGLPLGFGAGLGFMWGLRRLIVNRLGARGSKT